MKIPVEACDIHGLTDVKPAEDIVRVHGLLSKKEQKNAFCALCAERYWAGHAQLMESLQKGIKNGAALLPVSDSALKDLVGGKPRRRKFHRRLFDPQAFYLRLLSKRQRPAHLKDLAKQGHRTYASAFHAIDKLSRRGLVRNMGTAAHRNKWELTEKGRAELKKLLTEGKDG